MNDPFAQFDTVGTSKPASAANYATAPTMTPFGQAPPMTQPSPAPYPGSNPFGGPALMMGMAPQHQQPPMQSPMMMNNAPMYPAPTVSGASFMTQPSGVAAFSGLGQPVASSYHHQPHPQQQQSMYTPSLDPFATQAYATKSNSFGNSTNEFSGGVTRAPEPTQFPPTLTHSSSTVIDFDPFSPRDNTPQTPFDFPTSAGSSALADRSNKRQTQEEQRSQLGIAFDNFSGSTATQKISLKGLTPASQQQEPPKAANTSNNKSFFDDSPFFTESTDAFTGQNFANVDDEPTSGSDGMSSFAREDDAEEDRVSEECDPGEYDVTFETGRKLGVLMERVDVYSGAQLSQNRRGVQDSQERRQELAVVKLVVENGAADRVGVTIGSSVVAINGHSVGKDNYVTVLEMIKAASRPMTMRFKRGKDMKDTTQGLVLTRISAGTFSVGNLTSGNATWIQKYFAFGGAKMDVLQLFVSRAAYHECVISLYEKRSFHSQIQSFRLCRDHKISPVKSKIYKGYGKLHYFSLTVPSLRFVAAKFASEDYETLKNLWSNTYDAIERKKRMY